MSQDVEVKIKDVNGEEYSVKINQDAKVMDLLIKIKSEKILASAEKLKSYDSLSIFLRDKCITMKQNLYSENLPTLKDLGVDKKSEMKIVFSSNKDNKLANFIKFDEITDSFKLEDKDEITLKIKVDNKESYDIKMNKGAKISDLIAKVRSDKKIKELANGNDFFKITHFKNDKMNLQLCHTGFQNIELKNLFKETKAILDIKFGNVYEKNYAKFDQSPSNIPIENILINDADSSNIENINDNDTITLIICSHDKEVTRFNVTKTTTMREIKEKLQKQYDLSEERINELKLCYMSSDILSDLNATVEQVFDKKDIKKHEVSVHSQGFDFNLKTSEKEYDNKDSTNDNLDIFINVCNASGADKHHLGTAKKNTTVMDLIRDNLNLFRSFSKGFIIVFNSKEITGASNLENPIANLEEGSTITVYRAGCVTCDGKSLIKINENNYPLARIIICVIDLLLLAAAITTFLLYFLTALSFSIAVPIVLTVLFVIDTVLFLVWDYISPESWRKPPKNIKTEFNTEESSEFKQYRGSEITKNDLETEKKEPDGNNLKKQ